jgi:hypothetical protein
MERSGAHDGKGRCHGWFRTAEKEVMIVFGQMFARRSLPDRWAASVTSTQGLLPGRW